MLKENDIASVSKAAVRLIEQWGCTANAVNSIVTFSMQEGHKAGYEAGIEAAKEGRRKARSVGGLTSRSRTVAAFDAGYDHGRLMGVAEGRAELLAEMQVAVSRNNQQAAVAAATQDPNDFNGTHR